ncbi:LOW QUALITY PROTEIN: hypothetical protein PAHAL_7G153200 [Panicum hallii]|uniref:Uncharacterized protein n=1 Tax=Panicum hallii TaxID=206008 RepID=A0A2T8ICD6_9POAL|nr:LOW QUALITY PROTEIN: hypothetical protein PAHAL_7G153200 [Panicum hallii]
MEVRRRVPPPHQGVPPTGHHPRHWASVGGEGQPPPSICFRVAAPSPPATATPTLAGGPQPEAAAGELEAGGHGGVLHFLPAESEADNFRAAAKERSTIAAGRRGAGVAWASDGWRGVPDGGEERGRRATSCTADQEERQLAYSHGCGRGIRRK